MICSDIDFLVDRPYAKNMKTTKKLSAKRAVKNSTVKVSRRLRLLLIALIVSVLLLVAYLFKGYNPDLQQEADGFTKLKQDFLKLQQEFNKVDNGWAYSDGCTGSGGVFDRDKATDCSMSVTSNNTVDPAKILSYKDLAISNGVFDASSVKQIDVKAYSMKSVNFPSSNCVLEIIDENGLEKITLGCSGKAHYFHFPRTDR